MKILVIGSEGNVGGPLVEHLRGLGHEVHETDIKSGHRPEYSMADINNPVDLLESFDWCPDVVYLMAAIVSRVTCEQAGALAVSTNLSGMNNILQMAKWANAKVVFFSTSEVYGPTNEWMDEDLTIPKPNNRYGLTKYLGEQLVKYEVEQHGLSAIVVRPFMIYDENETLGDHRSAMVRFAHRLSRGKPIDVHVGTSRSWLHISDAVTALGNTINLKDFHIINIGHPESIPTVDLALMIQTKLGAPDNLLNFVSQPERMTPIKHPVLHKQASLLNMVPTVNIKEGVSLVCSRFMT